MNTGRRLSDKPDTAPLPVFVCMGYRGQAVRKTVLSVASKTCEGARRVAAVIEPNAGGLLNSTTDLA